jgi:hypothetical protein
MRKMLIVGTLVAIGFVQPALADWWIVRSSDKKCLVVDMEPTDKSVTKIGKGSYETEEEAEADAKRLCKEPTMVPKSDSDDGD